jgi:hypothetical protein
MPTELPALGFIGTSSPSLTNSSGISKVGEAGRSGASDPRTTAMMIKVRCTKRENLVVLPSLFSLVVGYRSPSTTELCSVCSESIGGKANGLRNVTELFLGDVFFLDRQRRHVAGVITKIVGNRFKSGGKRDFRYFVVVSQLKHFCRWKLPDVLSDTMFWSKINQVSPLAS